MKWIKGFQNQVQECNKTGNRFIVEHPFEFVGTIVCVPFKTYCHSNACMEKRRIGPDGYIEYKRVWGWIGGP